MQRRRTELALLVFAALIISGLYALSALGKTASLPANIGPFLIQVLALFLIAHLADSPPRAGSRRTSCRSRCS